MKRILITGANSYIGSSFEKYIHKNNSNDFEIDTLDMLYPEWKKHDFSGYSTVFHVAGIAHVDVGNVIEETKQLYYKVNCELAYETALKAKESGIKQFIYMSSIIVYGDTVEVITKDTKPAPSNFYGDSKLQAEIKLLGLQDNSFNIAIIRPPMIYGLGCKGNYMMLSKLARKLPVFPKIGNQRSMLYIENLCEFIRLLIEDNAKGIYYPQNDEYSSTYKIVKIINPKIKVFGLLNIGVKIGFKIPGKISCLCNKAFGSLVYEKLMSKYENSYNHFNLEESLKRTEGKV